MELEEPLVKTKQVQSLCELEDGCNDEQAGCNLLPAGRKNLEPRSRWSVCLGVFGVFVLVRWLSGRTSQVTLERLQTATSPPANLSLPENLTRSERLGCGGTSHTSEPPAGFLGTCDGEDQHGWPMFSNRCDLEKSPWAAYFEKVYGQVPEDGYPLCLSSLKFIYKNIADEAGVDLPKTPMRCPVDPGDIYYAGQGHDANGSLFVWNDKLASPAKDSIPSNHWIEFMHQAWPVDTVATWMYFLPGTGIWFNVGNTIAYNDHRDAADDLLGPGHCWDTECVDWFPQIYQAAKARGLDSIQFLYHRDMPCGSTALEVIDLGGSGSTACGSNSYRAGWRASAHCDCAPEAQFTNCKGFIGDRLAYSYMDDDPAFSHPNWR